MHSPQDDDIGSAPSEQDQNRGKPPKPARKKLSRDVKPTPGSFKLSKQASSKRKGKAAPGNRKEVLQKSSQKQMKKSGAATSLVDKGSRLVLSPIQTRSARSTRRKAASPRTDATVNAMVGTFDAIAITSSKSTNVDENDSIADITPRNLGETSVVAGRTGPSSGTRLAVRKAVLEIDAGFQDSTTREQVDGNVSNLHTPNVSLDRSVEHPDHATAAVKTKLRTRTVRKNSLDLSAQPHSSDSGDDLNETNENLELQQELANDDAPDWAQGRLILLSSERIGANKDFANMTLEERSAILTKYYRLLWLRFGSKELGTSFCYTRRGLL